MEDALDMLEESPSDIFGNDLQRLESTHWKAGYREGISDGQESALQEGFNEGFAQATHQYFQTSRLRGFVSALLIYLDANGGSRADEDCKVKLKSFLEDLKQIEAKDQEIDRTTIERLNDDYKKKNEPLPNENKSANLDSAIEMMDCFSLGEDKLDFENEKTECCANSECSQNSVSLNRGTDICKKNGNGSTCICNGENQNLTEDFVLRDTKSINSTPSNSKKQKLKPISLDFELKSLESLLENSNIPKSVIQKLKLIIKGK